MWFLSFYLPLELTLLTFLGTTQLVSGGTFAGVTASDQYSTSDVAGHASTADCWTTVSQNVGGTTRTVVLDATQFLGVHPGGANKIQCGADSSSMFTGQHGQTLQARMLNTSGSDPHGTKLIYKGDLNNPSATTAAPHDHSGHDHSHGTSNAAAAASNAQGGKYVVLKAQSIGVYIAITLLFVFKNM